MCLNYRNVGCWAQSISIVRVVHIQLYNSIIYARAFYLLRLCWYVKEKKAIWVSTAVSGSPYFSDTFAWFTGVGRGPRKFALFAGKECWLQSLWSLYRFHMASIIRTCRRSPECRTRWPRCWRRTNLCWTCIPRRRSNSGQSHSEQASGLRLPRRPWNR